MTYFSKFFCTLTIALLISTSLGHAMSKLTGLVIGTKTVQITLTLPSIRKCKSEERRLALPPATVSATPEVIAEEEAQPPITKATSSDAVTAVMTELLGKEILQKLFVCRHCPDRKTAIIENDNVEEDYLLKDHQEWCQFKKDEEKKQIMEEALKTIIVGAHSTCYIARALRIGGDPNVSRERDSLIYLLAILRPPHPALFCYALKKGANLYQKPTRRKERLLDCTFPSWVDSGYKKIIRACYRYDMVKILYNKFCLKNTVLRKDEKEILEKKEIIKKIVLEAYPYPIRLVNN